MDRRDFLKTAALAIAAFSAARPGLALAPAPAAAVTATNPIPDIDESHWYIELQQDTDEIPDIDGFLAFRVSYNRRLMLSRERSFLCSTKANGQIHLPPDCMAGIMDALRNGGKYCSLAHLRETYRQPRVISGSIVNSVGNCWLRAPFQTDLDGGNLNRWPCSSRMTLRDVWFCYPPPAGL